MVCMAKHRSYASIPHREGTMEHHSHSKVSIADCRRDMPTTILKAKGTICRMGRGYRSLCPSRTTIFLWASCSPYLLSSSSLLRMASNCASKTFTCCSSICFSCSFVSCGTNGVGIGVVTAVPVCAVVGGTVGGTTGRFVWRYCMNCGNSPLCMSH